MNYTKEFAVKLISAKDLLDAADGLDRMFEGKAHFYIVDEEEHEERHDYKKYLFAVWVPHRSTLKRGGKG